MLKRLMFVTAIFLCVPVQAEDIKAEPEILTLERTNIQRSGEITLKPELLILAKSIVADMVQGKSLDEILGMVNDIALALSEDHLCGTEAIQSMVDVGIPFEMTFDAIVKSCNLDAAEIAELNRSLSPGLADVGGAGGEVSP